MDVVSYFKSLTQELEAQKDRVRNFIHRSHWQTDGEWKESVLRSSLANRLPETIRVGRGFILNRDRASTQCDILLYAASSPVLFRQGDLVFLPPNAVKGVVEVKSRLDQSNLRPAIRKLAAIGKFTEKQNPLGLFSYETDITESDTVLRVLQQECNDWNKTIDILCLGCSMFIKWWVVPPSENARIRTETFRSKWHSYHLENMAAGYFLTNVIALTCENWVLGNDELWFPKSGKECYKTGEIDFLGQPGTPA